MIDLIMNEKEYIEDVIKTGNISKKTPHVDVNILVRYCFHELGLRRMKIIAYIDEFMFKHYPGYNPFQWHSVIEKYIRKAPGRNLIKVDSIPVTQKEIDTIRNIGDIEIEKILFTMLVIAKYKDIAFNSNGWVSESRDEIFKTANSKIKSSERNIVIHLLFTQGLLELTTSNKKENWKITFLDKDSEPVYTITDTRECGLQYMLLTNQGGVITCADCGRPIIKKKNSRTFRCRECQKIQDNLCKMNYANR